MAPIPWRTSSPRLPWRGGPGEDAWHLLRPSTRRHCLELLRRRSGALPAAPARARLELLSHGFCRSLHRLAADEPALSLEDVSDEALDLLGWLAVTQSNGLLGPSPLLRTYVQSLLVDGEDAVALAVQALDLRGERVPLGPPLWRFLSEQPQGERWLRWLRPTFSSGEERLFAALVAAGGRAPTHALPSLVPDLSGEELDRARWGLCRKLVLFHDLDPERLDLEVGFLASVRLALGPRRRSALRVRAATPTFSAVLLVDDALSLLHGLRRSRPRAGWAPPRTDAVLELSRWLDPVPAWVEERAGAFGIRRAVTAYEILRQGGYVDAEGRATASGRALARLSRDAQIRTLLEPRRWGPRDPVRACGVRSRLREGGGELPVLAAVRSAFAELGVGKSHSLADFVAWASQDGRAVVLAGRASSEVRTTVNGRPLPPFAEVHELASRRLLGELVAEDLLVHGGVALGFDGGELVFSLTPLGAWLIGLRESYPLRAIPAPLKVA